MNIVQINKRNAYKETELVQLINDKIKNISNEPSEIYERYRDYFLDRNEFFNLLNYEIDFCFDHYLFLEDFVGISIEEATKIVEDENIVSARGELNTPEETNFISMLNYLFDKLIEIERTKKSKLIASNDFMSGMPLLETSSQDKANFVMNQLEFNYADNLVDVLKKREGYYILEFPNSLNISGITLIKEGSVDNEKCACIYVNTSEPIGRKSFTIAHELYHVFFESSETQISYYSNKDEVERRADEFASYFQFNYQQLLDDVLDLGKSFISEISFSEIVDIQIRHKASFVGAYTALSRLKKHCEGSKFANSIPELPGRYYKYKHPSNWIELENKTNKRTNLNSCSVEYVIPTQLSYFTYNELIDQLSVNEVNSLYEFFEMECC